MKRISTGIGRLIGSWEVSALTGVRHRLMAGARHLPDACVLWYYRLMNAQVQAIARYITEIDKIYRAGNATEHSYRPSLKTLFESCFTDLKTPLKDSFTGLKNGLTITNEPKHIECGAPDYIITRSGIPVGYIEAKDIPVGSEYVTRELEVTKDVDKLAKMKALIPDYGITVIPANPEIERLADIYVTTVTIPAKYATDALHIATAAVAGLDYIISLNFRHIVKHKTIIETEIINAREGFKRVFIHTPAEVI